MEKAVIRLSLFSYSILPRFYFLCPLFPASKDSAKGNKERKENRVGKWDRDEVNGQARR
jgi:hypothetical protein